VGTYHFAAVSLRPGRESLLADDERLDAGNLPFTRLAPADFTAFLADTERAYFAGMVRYLKEDLGVRALVSGTQASYGGALGVLREATIADFIDMHGYWEHPRFPRVSWDRNDWNIPNTSMITSATGGVPGQRAWLRVLGMPFTVSEYDHPAPHDHAAEMMPMYATLAAVQDWDGIYSFSYLNGSFEAGVQKIDNYFTQATHPAKMSFMPVAAVLFRMGAVRPAETLLEATLSGEGLAAQMVDESDPFRNTTDPRGAYVARHRVGTRVSPAGQGLRIPATPVLGDSQTSDTGEVTWTSGTKGNFAVNTPAARVAIGWIQGKALDLGDARIEVLKAEDGWAAVAVCALDGLALDVSKKMLAVVVGRVENQDMGWNADRTSVGSKWGEGPCVAEGVVARLRVPGVVEVTALDGIGRPMGAVETQRDGAATVFETGPQHKTLWYAVTR
jgi:hypothetical protein